MKFQIGDKVVVRKPENISYSVGVSSMIDDGVINTWEHEMDQYDGTTFVIQSTGFGGYSGEKSTNYFRFIAEWLSPVVTEEN